MRSITRKADEEIFMHSSDDQQNSEQKKSGSSIALFKLPFVEASSNRKSSPRDVDERVRRDATRRVRRDGALRTRKHAREGKGEFLSRTTTRTPSHPSRIPPDDEQIEQAPLETVYVDVCVDSLYDGGLFFLQFLNVPFASASIPIVVTPFLKIKRELDKKFSNRKLGDGARVVLFKSAEITGGRGMD